MIVECCVIADFTIAKRSFQIPFSTFQPRKTYDKIQWILQKKDCSFRIRSDRDRWGAVIFLNGGRKVSTYIHLKHPRKNISLCLSFDFYTSLNKSRILLSREKNSFIFSIIRLVLVKGFLCTIFRIFLLHCYNLASLQREQGWTTQFTQKFCPFCQ